MQYGILIGRFQPLHKAHQSIIDEIMHDGRKPIIFIGSSNKSDEKNPFSYAERASIIHSIYGGEIITLPLPDNESDFVWAQQVWGTLRAMDILEKECWIYHYLKEGDFDISELFPQFRFLFPHYPEIYQGLSATKIRNEPEKYKQYLDGRVLKLLENKSKK